MAEVYRAQDNVLGRLVAVKVMLPQYAADPNFTQRFKQEAAAAANLQSPYIVNVYDWGQDEGTYYIVMEFVRGSDLKPPSSSAAPSTSAKSPRSARRYARRFPWRTDWTSSTATSSRRTSWCSPTAT